MLIVSSNGAAGRQIVLFQDGQHAGAEHAELSMQN